MPNLNSLAQNAPKGKLSDMGHQDAQTYLMKAYGVPQQTAALMAASPESRAEADAAIAKNGSPYSLDTPKGGAGSTGMGASRRAPTAPSPGGGGGGGGSRGGNEDGMLVANRSFNVHTGMNPKGTLRDDSATARLMAGKQPYDDPKSPQQPSRAKDGRAALQDQTTSAAEKEEAVKSFNVHGGKNAGGAMRASDIPAAKPAATTGKPTSLNLLDNPDEKNFLGTESNAQLAAERKGDQPPDRPPAEQQSVLTKFAHDDPANPANNLSQSQRDIAYARSSRDTEDADPTSSKDKSYMSASGTKRSVFGKEYDPREISHSRLTPKFTNEEHRADQQQRHGDRMKATADKFKADRGDEATQRQSAMQKMKEESDRRLAAEDPEERERRRKRGQDTGDWS